MIVKYQVNIEVFKYSMVKVGMDTPLILAKSDCFDKILLTITLTMAQGRDDLVVL